MEGNLMESTEPPYVFSRHAYACVHGEHVIFLDLASGDYLAIRAANARSLRRWIRGWPLADSPSDASNVLNQLLQAGLVTTDRRQGRENAFPVSPTQPSKALEDLGSPAAVQIRALDVFRFVRAAAVTAFCLRFVRLRFLVARTRWRKNGRREVPFDADNAHRLIAIFDRLYPWFIGARNQCLRNSFMLLEFLASYRVYPEWIFGVRTEPFKAHCWLQHRDLVLNDSVTATAGLTPIMIV